MPRATFLAKIPHFLAVGQAMNFSRAAERLGIAQPALSRSIRDLERELGFVLFDRSTRRVTLTAAGEVLYREANDAMQRLTRGAANAGRAAMGMSGTVNIGYSAFAANGPMSDIIIEFRKRYPDVQVGLRVLASSEQSVALDDDAIDLGFMMSNACTPEQRQFAISSERLVVLVPTTHPHAAKSDITLYELSAIPLVIGTLRRWRGFRALIDILAASHGLSLTIADEADEVPVLLQLVRSGFGFTILDASFIQTLPPSIKALEIRDITSTLNVSLTWREENASPLVERFVKVAQDVIGADRRVDIETSGRRQGSIMRKI